MGLDPKAQAALALHRFGFGPRPGSINAIASDPRGALVAELHKPGAGLTAARDLPTAAQTSRAVFEFNAERQAQDRLEKLRREAEQQKLASAGTPPVLPPQPPPASASPASPPPVPVPTQLFNREAKARFDAAIDGEIGFVERLVWFWSNHFCVSADKVQAAVAGAYEREAIRPYVLGHFGAMLEAVETHPAMLQYLDNAQSIGPNSIDGINRTKGLNENLARETLELHTLGVRTVYTQEDVTNLAKVITGWTVVPQGPDPAHGGEFVFNRLMHEPGAQTIIGKTYPGNGVAQGRAVLQDLAHHPAAAHHLAAKLLRHFITDQPPPALVERLARRFIDTNGDLKDLALELISVPEAFAPSRTKLKRPTEWIVSSARAIGMTSDLGPLFQAQNLLGEPLWRPPAPIGYSDDSAAWIDGLAQRLDIANTFARRTTTRTEPMELLEASLGPLASAETRQAVSRAESRDQALALLLLAPEFQRR